MELKPDLKIRFHGGWKHEGARCEVCKFPCAYIDPGVVIERYQIWSADLQSFILHPDDLWVARLETGSFVIGYSEQFEIVV